MSGSKLPVLGSNCILIPNLVGFLFTPVRKLNCVSFAVTEASSISSDLCFDLIAILSLPAQPFFLFPSHGVPSLQQFPHQVEPFLHVYLHFFFLPPPVSISETDKLYY